MTFACPVCGYSQLPIAPEESPICPSCGTEFEIDDRYLSHAELRDRWLDAGAPWFSGRVSPPEGWQNYRRELLWSHQPTNEAVLIDDSKSVDLVGEVSSGSTRCILPSRGLALMVESELRLKLANLLSGDLSLDEFEDWFTVASWNAHKGSSQAAQDLVGAVELRLSEHSNDHLSLQELQQELEALVLPPAVAPAPSDD